MKNLSLKSRIYCLIGLFLGSFAAATGLLLGELSRQAALDSAFTTSQLAAQDSARIIQLDFKKQVQAWKDLLLRGSDPASFQKYRDEFFKKDGEVRNGAQSLQGRLSDPEIKAELASFMDSHQTLEAEYRVALQDFDRSQGRDFRAADTRVKGKDRPVTDAVDRIVADLNARTNAYQVAKRKQFVTRVRFIFVGILAATLTLLALGIYIAASINRSTRELVGFLAAQVSELREGRGDLTRRLECNSQDEFGEIADAFNAYNEAMENIVRKLSQCIAQIASASEEISSSASLSAENGRLQADEASQVATAIEEMSAAVQQVAANSQRASGSALKAAKSAREGGEIVKQTVGTMQGVANASHRASERIAGLGQASGRIGEIVAVIDDIADQTNLLALNAAIEAARSGESGRGFAVVADEVRKLAERTAKATKEIAAMIQCIRESTAASVAAVEQGSREAQAGVGKASSSGEALDEIIQLATSVGDMISHIAAAASEQSAATAQVNSSISRIASLTQNSSVSAQETAKACMDLSQLALELESLIRGFKHNGRGNQTVPAGFGSQTRRILAASQPSASLMDKGRIDKGRRTAAGLLG